MRKVKKDINALVTGGCGFIGSHLVERLTQDGYKVAVVDNLNSGKVTNLKNVFKTIKFYESNIQDINFSKIKKPNVIFHLAAQASVPFSCEQFYCSSKNNLLSSIKILEFCSNNNIPLIYASSSAVYGNLPFGTESGATQLLSPYAADKLSLEIYAKMAAETYELRSFGLRFFNVYGPRQDPQNPYSGVISIFADRIKKHKCIRINGGSQSRDFIHVSDIVQALIRAYLFLQKKSGAFVSNVLTGRPLSINQLADLCEKQAGYKVRREYFPMTAGDPKQSKGNLSTMLSALKMRPEVRLEDGLQDLLFRKRN